ncbi:hypothetical protein [Kitasatospora fiedleri]|uniref:hypothetical protein n=1 Tax=Kitasatospora fiedleri TaxID=2991545 RepID=UPI00249CD023|nr:hypothetical protein [Kitasatospora fiedleri]
MERPGGAEAGEDGRLGGVAVGAGDRGVDQGTVGLDGRGPVAGGVGDGAGEQLTPGGESALCGGDHRPVVLGPVAFGPAFEVEQESGQEAGGHQVALREQPGGAAVGVGKGGR